MRPTMIILSVALLAPSIAAQPVAAPAETAATPRAFAKAEAAPLIEQLATELEENFVFPTVGKAYAARLRARLAAGAYDGFDDSRAFARQVTEDLQAVHADKHLALHLRKTGPGRQSAGATRSPQGDGNAISKSGWLAPGIAYIRFEGFPGNSATKDSLRRFIDEHQGAKSLIIDARSHRGGGLAEMDLLFPQLFKSPTTLVGMDTRIAVEERRSGEGGEEEWSLRKVPGPEGVVRREHFVEPASGGAKLADTSVFLLTSNATGSAGEHLALSLKRTGRATLIGEATRGMGHYGGLVPIGEDFVAFIPVGRTFDPDTGLGWEGTGIAPNVAIPADEALDEALRRAGARIDSKAALAALG